MATVNLVGTRQVIDYLPRDYATFRQALIDLIPQKLPEWTDRSESDFGIVLLELFSYMADILSYYQDRLANEAFLSTAQERRSVLQHLRLIGYEMAPAAPAAAHLSIVAANTVTGTIEIRKGDQFSATATQDRPSVLFEYAEDKPLVIDLGDPSVMPDSARAADGQPLPGFKEFANRIPVREGQTIANEVIGISNGVPDQRFRLAQPRVLRGSLEVVVQTTPPTPPWRLRRHLVLGRRAASLDQLGLLERDERLGATLAFSTPADPDFAIEVDEDDVTTVVFGDGEFGQIPPAGTRIVASYRVGGGSVGNVGAGQIATIARAPQLQLLGARVLNRTAATGGSDREAEARAIKLAPIAFSSMQRAVTRADYAAHALLVAGVAKARVDPTNWNVVRLYVAPAGGGSPSDVLRRDLLAYFEDKRMVSSLIEVESAEYVGVDVQAQVGALPYYRNADVQQAAVGAIRALLDFDGVDFGQTLYLSKVYEALEGLDGAANVFVSRFRRATDAQDIAPGGVITLAEHEVPIAGAITVTVTGGA